MSTLLPARVKTFQITGNVNSGGGSTLVTGRNHLYNAKQGLISVPLFPCTVLGSSNGAAFGLDAVDRWSSGAAVAAGAWIVLKQVGIAANFQVCWHNTENGVPRAQNELIISHAAGFTGGGATARPTATDELSITVSQTMIDGATANAVFTNVAVSDDGQCMRIWAFQNGVVVEWTVIDKIQNPIAELTSPWIGYSTHATQGAGAPGAASFNNFDATGPIRSKQGVTTLDYALYLGNRSASSDRVGKDATVNNGVNQLSADYPILPVALVCETASNQGVHGEIADLWYGSVTAANGDTYPEAAYAGAGGLDQFIQVGDVIHAWNGTVPSLGAGASTRRQGRVIHFFQSVAVEEEEEEEEEVPLPPVLFTNTLPNDDQSDFGIDIDVLNELPKTFVLASGRRNLGNAIARRLQTPAGFFALAFGGDPDYGLDLRGRLNLAQSLDQIAALEAEIKDEVEKDERVLSADVTATYSLATATLSVQINLDTAQGPFALVLNVSALTTELVLAPAL